MKRVLHHQNVNLKRLKKRERTQNWALEEKRFLLELCRKDMRIIENKRLDADLTSLKNKAWRIIHQEFSKAFGNERNCNRLKEQWRRIKACTRSEIMDYHHRLSRYGEEVANKKRPHPFTFEVWEFVQEALKACRSAELKGVDYATVQLSLEELYSEPPIEADFLHESEDDDLNGWQNHTDLNNMCQVEMKEEQLSMDGEQNQEETNYTYEDDDYDIAEYNLQNNNNNNNNSVKQKHSNINEYNGHHNVEEYNMVNGKVSSNSNRLLFKKFKQFMNSQHQQNSVGLLTNEMLNTISSGNNENSNTTNSNHFNSITNGISKNNKDGKLILPSSKTTTISTIDTNLPSLSINNVAATMDTLNMIKNGHFPPQNDIAVNSGNDQRRHSSKHNGNPSNNHSNDLKNSDIEENDNGNNEYYIKYILNLQRKEHFKRMEIMKIQLQTVECERETAEINKKIALKKLALLSEYTKNDS